jgi:hypothetical protein
VLEDGVLRIIHGTKPEEETGRMMKSRRMRRTRHVPRMEEMKIVYKVLVEKPESIKRL